MSEIDIKDSLQKKIKSLQEEIYKIQITGEIPNLSHYIKIRKSFKRFLKENPEYKEILENKSLKTKDLPSRLIKLSRVMKSEKFKGDPSSINMIDSKYIRIAIYMDNIDNLLHDIVNCEDEYYTLPNGYKVRPDSLRYQTFDKSLVCTKCGIKGRFLALERCISDIGGREGSKEGQGFHLNLYALNEYGEEILMTKDHIIPKSKGGSDDLSNLQTMCTICNGKKGDKLPEDIDLKEDK